MPTVREVLGEDKVAELTPLMWRLDAIVELTRQDAPFMLPVVGELSDIISALAVRVAELEVKVEAVEAAEKATSE